MLNIKMLRKEYRLKSLDLNALDSDPFLQFMLWFQEVLQTKVEEPNAMALATASTSGHPSCRMVLLKAVDGIGFLFFTNYQSRKGRELDHNPFACATFYWKELERQVIIEGAVERLIREESEHYFASRPRGSQIGAWASQQDRGLKSRKELEESFLHYERLYEGKTIPTPPYWGGYRLIPHRFEFWQGREDRMHDRLCYKLDGGKWNIERLAP